MASEQPSEIERDARQRADPDTAEVSDAQVGREGDLVCALTSPLALASLSSCRVGLAEAIEFPIRRIRELVDGWLAESRWRLADGEVPYAPLLVASDSTGPGASLEVVGVPDGPGRREHSLIPNQWPH